MLNAAFSQVLAGVSLLPTPDPSAGTPTGGASPAPSSTQSSGFGGTAGETISDWSDRAWHYGWRIVAIIASALVLRWVVFRLIGRLEGRLTAVDLQPRLSGSRSGRLLLDSTPLLTQRRNQRVGTLGSAMRSLTSFLLFMAAAFAILVLFQLTSITTALTSASVLAAAVVFGAQALLRDFITGAFLIVEDQYGVGDTVDTGTVSGKVEAVGLRITKVRDDNGVLWYLRNGEILRVGNKSQGWGNAVVDVPVPYDANPEAVRSLLTEVMEAIKADPKWSDDLISTPDITWPEGMSPDWTLFRIAVKTPFGEQFGLQREIRIRVKAALDAAGLKIAAQTPPPAA